jgi:hypothetical protein
MPFSTDSMPAGVPSYPAIAVEANPASQVKWPTIRTPSPVFQHMALQPFPVPEQRTQRACDLPMLIAFRAGGKRAGVSQNIATVLDQLRLAVKRRIQRQRTSDRRHDATYIDSGSP